MSGPAGQIRRGESTETHAGWAKFQIKNLVLIYIVYFWCYGTGTGKYRAGSTGFPWQIPEGHMCLRSPDMAKMDPSAADMALAVWNGYVQDARRHARQWRPVEQVLQDSNDVGLVARAKSRSSWSQDTMLSLVVFSAGCMVLLKIHQLHIILLIKFNKSLVAPYSLHISPVME